jgi:hypothetical protein
MSVADNALQMTIATILQRHDDDDDDDCLEG